MMPWSLFCLALQFDGSLRPPRDTGFPTHGLCRMASCGAAIQSNGMIMALGGKSIPMVPGLTSADVEYDGLLFGLGWLNRQTEEWWDQYKQESLVIRGDCKAIIDQLEGSSIPRKVRARHEVALGMLYSVSNHVDISYEHVLRKENHLCDSICAAVMSLSERSALSCLRQEIASAPSPGMLALRKKRKQEIPESHLALILKRYLQENSLIRYSVRPALYKEAAMVAEKLGDAVALHLVGEMCEVEAKLWSNRRVGNFPDAEVRNEIKQQLTIDGLLLQIRGLQMMGREKEANRLLQKHRYALQQQHFAVGQIQTKQRGLGTLLESWEFNVPPCIESADAEASVLKSWYDRAQQSCRPGQRQTNDGHSVLDQECWFETHQNSVIRITQ